MIALAEQKALQVIWDAWRTANEDTSRTFEELKKKVRNIIRDAIKIAEEDSGSILVQAEEKAPQIVEESKKKAQTEITSDNEERVERVADAPQTQGLQQTFKPIIEKVAPEMEDEKEEQGKKEDEQGLVD